jgi:hypothetical protein
LGAFNSLKKLIVPGFEIMKKSGRIALGFVLGAVPPVVGFLAFWWSSIPFLPERVIFVWAVLGLMTGFIIDIIYLKKWVVG